MSETRPKFDPDATRAYYLGNIERLQEQMRRNERNMDIINFIGNTIITILVVIGLLSFFV